VWAGSHGWIPTPPPEDLLCFAAAALAGSVALDVVAFELDLPGYRLGWRQLATGVAAVAVVVGGVPTMAAAGNGRWHLPSADPRSVLGFLPSPSRGDYRVLWLGSPDALPLGSRSLAGGMAYATSFDGDPVEADQWTPASTPGASAMAADIRSSEVGLTTELGRLLAPYGVRYIVVPNHNAPSGSGAAATPVDASLLTGLSDQTDLESVSSDLNYTIYANAAWVPIRSVSSPRLAAVVDAPQSAQARLLTRTNLVAGSRALLTGSRQDWVRGTLVGGSTITVSMSRSGPWTLAVDGHKLAPERGYGWAMRFRAPSARGSRATLSAGTEGGVRIRQEVGIGLWVLALALLVFDRRRRLGGTPERVKRAWFMPPEVHRSRRSRAASPSGMTADESDPVADELWVDA
ncbi:MAG: hypothetical protein J2P58_13720, partial [Acidimicrobiaceae bacterium]|nr:hypothetical protein [Acidimicrobiaceae bacterium]